MIKAADSSIALSVIWNVSVMEDGVENRDTQSPLSSDTDPIFIVSKRNKRDDFLPASAAKFWQTETQKRLGLCITMRFCFFLNSKRMMVKEDNMVAERNQQDFLVSATKDYFKSPKTPIFIFIQIHILISFWSFFMKTISLQSKCLNRKIFSRIADVYFPLYFDSVHTEMYCSGHVFLFGFKKDWFLDWNM